MRTLIANGDVLVMDGKTPVRQALVFEDDRILGTGSVADMKRLAGPDCPVLDVGGACVMPGIVDTHSHILHFAAMFLPLLDITGAVSHDDIVERIRRRAAVTPKGNWIVTTPVGEPHYFRRRSYRDLEERHLPDRHVLDRATTDHPVLIQAWGPIQPAVCAFNSAGLKAVHLSSHIPDVVSNVRFDKTLGGELTGVLRGAVTSYLNFDPYWGQIQTKIMMQIGATAGNFGAISPEALKDEIRKYHARGVTTAHECHVMTQSDIAAYRGLRDAGELTMRVLTCLEPEAGFHHFPLDPPPLETVRQRMELGRSLECFGDGFLRVEGLSQSLGGPCSAGHFMTYEPYPDPYGKPTYGLQASPTQNCEAFIDFCTRHDMRMNLVTGSIPEHDMVLRLSEEAERRNGKGNSWILQHAVLASPAQVKGFRRLDFKVATNVSFSWGKGDIYRERMGQHVLRDLAPLKRMLDAGLQVSLGSDWGPPGYFEHMRLAQTHEFCGSGYRNDGPDHAVTREQAVAMWTREAGRVMDWDGIGTLEPGTLADLIVVDRNPLTCGIDDLPDTRVLRTVVGGKVVHDTGELA